MMHTRQLQYDYHGFLRHIEPMLWGADIAIVNAEFTLGGKPYSGYPAFSAPDGYAEYLAEDCGVDLLLMANNHILDKGASGLKRTLNVYDSLGVLHTGIHDTLAREHLLDPAILQSKGLHLAFINFTYGTNVKAPVGFPKVSQMDKDEVSRAFEKAKSAGADFIIALPHWGEEYKLRHNPRQEQWAKWLVEQGADAVIGSHPHVVQDSTHVEGVPVIYSTGNLISNMSAPNTRVGLLVELRFVTSPQGQKMLEPLLHFTWCSLPEKLSADNYHALLIKEWANRRIDWLTPSDFDNMSSTLERVKKETGIE